MSVQEISRREADLQEDPSLLSPPVVIEPIYRCATAVMVTGAVLGATVEVEVNGAPAGNGIVDVVLPYGIAVQVPALEAGDTVRARQQTTNAISDWSDPPVTVRDHARDFPTGPPRPEVFGLPLHQCGVRTGVGNLLAGGNVWVTADGAEVGRVNGCGNPQGVNLTPSLGLSQKVRAWSDLCGDPSPPSVEHTAVAPPAPIPAPTVRPLYEGSTQLEVSGVLNGAAVTVTRNGVTLGTWGCWGGSIRIAPIAPPLTVGETVDAVQALCPDDPSSDPGKAEVEPCSSMPAPRCGPIQGGDTSVTFTDYVPGAVLSVWLNGQPVGKGGGPTVSLTGPIGFGDIVVIAQDLPGCTGQRALRITVPCTDPPVGADPAGLNLFPVGVTDFSDGPHRGRIYYPAQDDGTDVAFNERLTKQGPVPLVVMAHGNHSPRDPNYLGYEYFQASLARMGIIAASVDCNAMNGMGYSITIIEGRADLIIGAIAVIQQLDADPASVLHGRVDFARVGLMGHSQGGEAVVLVPEVISLAAVRIRAVIALAPTEGGATQRTPTGYAFMTVLPAADGDVWPNDGAIYYDRATPSPVKSQLYVHRTNHQFYNRVWLDDDSLWPQAAPTAPVISRTQHERTLDSYGCAFYRATLLGHGTDQYLSGQLLPAGVSTQHVHLSFAREAAVTVDDHEDVNGIQTNSLGAPTHQSGGLAADEFPFHRGPGAFNGSFYGDSIGMIAPAGGNGREFVQEIDRHDVTGHEVWVRVAEVFTAADTTAPPTGFKLGLRDAHGTESWVDSDEVGGVPRPFPRNPATMKTMLKTLRFRTGCFATATKLDLTAVTAILFRFDRRDERDLALDDLQIVRT